jgi:hypothetical protein
MSFEEKRAWIYLVITLGLPAAYFVVMSGRIADTEVAEVAYVWPLLITLGAAIVLNIVATIVAAIAAPRDAGRKDERDADIGRYGAHVEYGVLVVGVVGALGLTMAEYQHFWIANAIYLAFVLSSIVGTAARIAAYRRGFQPW